MKVLLINKYHFLKGGAERVYLDTKKVLEDNGHNVICFSIKVIWIKGVGLGSGER